jgi:hypothetical protein
VVNSDRWNYFILYWDSSGYSNSRYYVAASSSLHFLASEKRKGECMTVITEEGCVIHLRVQWDRCEDGASVFKCLDCGLDVVKEMEDTGCGG